MLCLSRAATAKKSARKRRQCTSCMCRVMFCLLKSVACHAHKKLALSTHLIAYAWIQSFKSFNDLKRHKKDKNNQKKFTYVCVNLILPPSLASGKREIELKKANRWTKHFESFICNETLFLSQKLHHKVKPAEPRTTYVTLHMILMLKVKVRARHAFTLKQKKLF